MSAPQYPGKQRDMECCCQWYCSNCLTVFDATVSFSTQTYRHNYPQASPKRCQKVVESTVWYGSLECPFSPSIQKMINKSSPPPKTNLCPFFKQKVSIFSYPSVWQTKQELPVKSAWSSQGGINGVQSVCSSYDNHLPSGVQSIH